MHTFLNKPASNNFVKIFTSVVSTIDKLQKNFGARGRTNKPNIFEILVSDQSLFAKVRIGGDTVGKG